MSWSEFLRRLVFTACIVAAVIFVAYKAAGGSAAAKTPDPSWPCHVVITDMGGYTAQATVVSGCAAQGYALRAFTGIRTTTQYGATVAVTGPVTNIAVPHCGTWQVDFSYMPGTPQWKWYAGKTGDSGPCNTPTTTTTTPTTQPQPVNPPPAPVVAPQTPTVHPQAIPEAPVATPVPTPVLTTG